MRVQYFSFDANPALDKPTCKMSHFRASQLIESNQAIPIDEKRIQGLPPVEYRTDARNYVTAGTMRDAWQIRESAGFLVLQMKTENNVA